MPTCPAEMHCRFIKRYALAGQRSAAQRQYGHCIAILAEELGVDPTLTTLAAYGTAL